MHLGSPMRMLSRQRPDQDRVEVSSDRNRSSTKGGHGCHGPFGDCLP